MANLVANNDPMGNPMSQHMAAAPTGSPSAEVEVKK